MPHKSISALTPPTSSQTLLPEGPHQVLDQTAGLFVVYAVSVATLVVVLEVLPVLKHLLKRERGQAQSHSEGRGMEAQACKEMRLSGVEFSIIKKLMNEIIIIKEKRES